MKCCYYLNHSTFTVAGHILTSGQIHGRKAAQLNGDMFVLWFWMCVCVCVVFEYNVSLGNQFSFVIKYNACIKCDLITIAIHLHTTPRHDTTWCNAMTYKIPTILSAKYTLSSSKSRKSNVDTHAHLVHEQCEYNFLHYRLKLYKSVHRLNFNLRCPISHAWYH